MTRPRISTIRVYGLDELDPDDIPRTREPRMVRCWGCNETVGVKYPLRENARDAETSIQCDRCRRLEARGTSAFSQDELAHTNYGGGAGTTRGVADPVAHRNAEHDPDEYGNECECEACLRQQYPDDYCGECDQHVDDCECYHDDEY